MALKKSLVEVTHDEGYGDSLLMHINLAFGGKDMRADKIVNPVASALQIEGIPDGWELVRVGKAKRGDFYVDYRGDCCEHTGTDDSQNYVIIRKIEKPKQFRPFANAAEFEPHRDRWLVFFDDEYSELSDQKSRVLVYGDDCFWIGEDGSRFDWNEAFKSWRFEDGTPFGVEVAE